jgi:hypothetical protein
MDADDGHSSASLTSTSSPEISEPGGLPLVQSNLAQKLVDEPHNDNNRDEGSEEDDDENNDESNEEDEEDEISSDTDSVVAPGSSFAVPS